MSRINRFLGQKLVAAVGAGAAAPASAGALQLLSHALPPSPSSNVTAVSASWLAIRPTTAQTFL